MVVSHPVSKSLSIKLKSFYQYPSDPLFELKSIVNILNIKMEREKSYRRTINIIVDGQLK